MADYDFVLKITDDASGTVTLSSSPFAITKRGYIPRVARKEEPSLEESMVVRIDDGAVADNLDEFRELQRLLIQAGDAQKNRSLDKVYVVFKESASADEYRSELTGGFVEWQDTALDYEYWTNDVQIAEIEWQRANWWEGPEVQVPLTNENGTAVLTNLDVLNCNDGSEAGDGTLRYNYVSIPGTAITGELPAPTRLELVNTYDTQRLAQVWIGHNYTDPDNMEWMLDGFDATGGTVVTSGAYNKGAGREIGVLPNSEVEIFTWTISGAHLDAYGGRTYKVFIRPEGSFSEDIRYRLELKYEALTIWDSDLISFENAIGASRIREICNITLPPWLGGLTNQSELTLVMSAYHEDTVQREVNCDFLMLVPLDSYTQVDQSTFGMEENDRLIIDGILDKVYADDGAGSALVGNFAQYGRHIMLKPTVDQRLYFQMHSQLANLASNERSIGVKLFTRPRRLSL